MIPDEKSYYIRPHYTPQGKLTFFIEFYDEFWDNGFTSDYYIVSPMDIYFEATSNSGRYPSVPKNSKRIVASDYARLEKIVKQSKLSAMDMIRKHWRPLDRQICVGDYLVHYRPADEYNDEPNCELDEILSVRDKSYWANTISITKNYFEVWHLPFLSDNEYISDWLQCKASGITPDEDLGEYYLINKEIYDKTKALVGTTCEQMYTECKRILKWKEE